MARPVGNRTRRFSGRGVNSRRPIPNCQSAEALQHGQAEAPEGKQVFSFTNPYPPPSPIPQKERADPEEDYARGESLAGASQRPPEHDQHQAAPRPQNVDELVPARVHHGVGREEGRLQLRRLRIRDRDLALNRLNSHRQRLPVEVADGDGRRKQRSHLPADAARHFTSSPAPTTLPASAG